jgi:hypothetical protein
MSDPIEPVPDEARARFRRTLGRVLIVQLVSMAVLGLIQILYSR